MKTILITGSTDGIGKLAAIKMANDGHTIYLHGRNSEKLSAVIDEIKKESGNNNINGFVADLSDLNNVINLASEIKKDLSKIDVLINNAGVYESKVPETKSGLDIRFVVNYLAPYLLTQELLPLVESGGLNKIINLSSAAQDSVSLEALKGNEKLDSRQAYAQSKLALTMWSFNLAKQHSNLEVIAVNPGSLLNTNMVKEAFGHHRSSADKGATILYELAVSEKYDNASGKYFDNDQGSFNTAHADAYNSTKIEELMKLTENLIEKKL